MSAAAEHSQAIDADLVAAQFDVLDSDTHRKALLEAIRARDAYRKLIDQLNEKIAKLEQGLIGPKSERFKGDPGDDPQLSLQVLAELLGRHEVEGADAQACCLSGYSTASLSRCFVMSPARRLALRDRLRMSQPLTESERPARA